MSAPLYDLSAPKKATNLSINSELLLLAKKLKINLSNETERHLATIVRQQLSRQWLSDNESAIDQHNERMQKNGVFSDKVRRF